MRRDLDAFGSASHHLYRRRTHDVAANWKLVIDAFLESYHVQRLHAQTIAHLLRRRHHRRRLRSARTSAPRSAAPTIWPKSTATTGRQLRKAVTYTYQLFPDSVIIVSPDYINMLVVMPQSVGRTAWSRISC